MSVYNNSNPNFTDGYKGDEVINGAIYEIQTQLNIVNGRVIEKEFRKLGLIEQNVNVLFNAIDHSKKKCFITKLFYKIGYNIGYLSVQDIVNVANNILGKKDPNPQMRRNYKPTTLSRSASSKSPQPKSFRQKKSSERSDPQPQITTDSNPIHTQKKTRKIIKSKKNPDIGATSPSRQALSSIQPTTQTSILERLQKSGLAVNSVTGK